jgi:hypothetical protein
MEAPEAYHSHPPNPELLEQLLSRVGYVEDAFEARTPLADFFSILLNAILPVKHRTDK